MSKQPPVEPVDYGGERWSRDGETILKWDGEQRKPWSQENNSGSPPPRFVFKSKQAATGVGVG